MTFAILPIIFIGISIWDLYLEKFIPDYSIQVNPSNIILMVLSVNIFLTIYLMICYERRFR